MLNVKAACSLKRKSCTYPKIISKHDKNKNTTLLKGN